MCMTKCFLGKDVNDRFFERNCSFCKSNWLFPPSSPALQLSLFSPLSLIFVLKKWDFRQHLLLTEFQSWLNPLADVVALARACESLAGLWTKSALQIRATSSAQIGTLSRSPKLHFPAVLLRVCMVSPSLVTFCASVLSLSRFYRCLHNWTSPIFACSICPSQSWPHFAGGVPSLNPLAAGVKARSKEQGLCSSPSFSRVRQMFSSGYIQGCSPVLVFISSSSVSSKTGLRLYIQ